MQKILSIAIPSYNVEAFLERGLESFVDPYLEEVLEVLIVDDGSQDRTREIAEEFCARYPGQFRCISKENGGHGSAVNAGLKAATGRYFRIVDGDDWVHTLHLVELCKTLDTLDCTLVVDVKREVVMNSTQSELFALPAYIPCDQVLPFEEICTREDIGSYIMIHTLTAKTDYLRTQNIALLEHCFYVDYEYIVKASVPALDIYFINRELYQYQIGNDEQSVSATSYVKRWDNHVRVLQELIQYERRCTQEGLSGARADYLARKITLMIHTLYNIALIFDTDRARGRKRARKLRAYLESTAPQHKQATNKRYYQACILHYLGFDQPKLKRLRSRHR